MTSHRASSDSQFDTHLATLSESSLDAKISAWTSLSSDLSGEKTELHSHQSQVTKHRKKVADMLIDLEKF